MFIDRNGGIGTLGSYRSSSGMVVSLEVRSVGRGGEGRHSAQQDEPTRIRGDDSIFHEIKDMDEG